jgi:hypothetical protein
MLVVYQSVINICHLKNVGQFHSVPSPIHFSSSFTLQRRFNRMKAGSSTANWKDPPVTSIGESNHGHHGHHSYGQQCRVNIYICYIYIIATAPYNYQDQNCMEHIGNWHPPSSISQKKKHLKRHTLLTATQLHHYMYHLPKSIPKSIGMSSFFPMKLPFWGYTYHVQTHRKRHEWLIVYPIISR